MEMRGSDWYLCPREGREETFPIAGCITERVMRGKAASFSAALMKHAVRFCSAWRLIGGVYGLAQGHRVPATL